MRESVNQKKDNMSDMDIDLLGAEEVIELVKKGEIQLTDVFHSRDSEIIWRATLKILKRMEMKINRILMLAERNDSNTRDIKDMIDWSR